MDSAIVDVAQVVAVVGAGLMAGVFFAFSVLVMPSLAALPAKRGIAAMQRINASAQRPLFMLAFVLPGLASVVVLIAALGSQNDAGAGLSLGGALLYLFGIIALTGLYFVPRNNRLAALTASEPAAQDYWVRFQQEWVAMNHWRAVIAVASALTFATGMS